jgi:hypothetical protein
MRSVQRFLLLGGVGLIRGDIKNAGPALVAVCDELDPVLRSSGFAERAPFERLDGIIRFGERTTETPELGPIQRGGLPFAIEVPLAPLRRASLEVVQGAFRRACLLALIHIGRVYDLPVAALEERL